MLVPIHDRMPAILEGDDLALWLNPNTLPGDPAVSSGMRKPTLQVS